MASSSEESFCKLSSCFHSQLDLFVKNRGERGLEGGYYDDIGTYLDPVVGRITSFVSSAASDNNGKDFAVELLCILLNSVEMQPSGAELPVLIGVAYVCGALALRQLMNFGEYLDTYTEALDRCSLHNAIRLCSFFCDQHSVLATLFEQQKAATIRVARARLLAVANAFERSLDGGPEEATVALARLRVVCFDRIPMSFQGLCNKGIRDAPGRHYLLRSDAGIEPAADVEDVELRAITKPIEKEDEFLSDSSSGSVKNYKNVPEKRRRTSSSTSSAVVKRQAASGEKKSSRTIETSYVTMLALFRQWEHLVNFIQDPSLCLSSMSTAEAIETISSLTKVTELAAQDTTAHCVQRDVTFVSPLPLITYTSCSGDQGNGDAPAGCFDTAFSAAEHSKPPVPRSLRVLSSKVEEKTDDYSRSLLFYNVKHSFMGFREAWSTEFFKRDVLMRVVAMLRVFHIKRQQCGPHTAASSAPTNAAASGVPDGPVSLFDLLSPSVKSAVVQLHDALYQLLPNVSSCVHGVPPVPTAQVPWFAVPRVWRPPLYLSAIVNEFDNQEAIMAHWKKEGCLDRKPPSWYEPLTINFSVPNEDNSPVPQELLRHPHSQCSGTAIHTVKPTAKSAFAQNAQLYKRQAVYEAQLLPVLRNLDPVERPTAGQSPQAESCSESITVMGQKELYPPSFSRERLEWFLPEPASPPLPLSIATVLEKLREKWGDYKEKVILDEDPVNEIEECEKVVKDTLFQWRCDRLLNLTNLKLYDYTNQNRELRVKIREASLEDLIRAAIQRETVKT